LEKWCGSGLNWNPKKILNTILGYKEDILSSDKKAKQCLGLFAKDPLYGDAKSRLEPVYDKDFRQGLAESFLKDAFQIADPLEGIDKVLNFSPPRSAGRMSQYLLPGWIILAQEGEDLGRRMEFFFHWAFQNGYRQAVLIGTDFPTLPTSFLKQAFDLLRTQSLVLGPSTDGGYYLIGLTKPHPEIFHDIKWSSNRVFTQTIDRLKEEPGLLPPWYDIDFPDDLAMLIGHLRGMIAAKEENLPQYTLRFLQHHHLL
jgi:rSAM/selenodomain-associated transferase 1